jgi:cytidine deaminase
LSDSDNRPAKPVWPAVERRTQPDRRVDRSGTAARRIPKEDVEVRTPPSLHREERRSGKDRRDDSTWKSVSLEITIATEADLAEALVAAATMARTRAHARYSGFKVGAALETGDGDVITGCNVENATYGLTLCAERVALVKALSEGHNIFTRIVVVADTENPTPPCGSCRQLLWEYCGDIEVILANLERTAATMRLSELLPLPFDARLLE